VSPFFLSIIKEEKRRKTPKSRNNQDDRIEEEIKKPVIAPATVPISRRTATRMFVKWSLRKLAAAPEEVAIIDMRLAATAYLMSTPKRRVSAGTTIIPPPNPKRDPRKPAEIEMNIRRRLYIALL
jgi:hypothetical protein